MHHVRVVLMVALCCVSFCAAGELFERDGVVAQQELRLKLSETRTANSDLEVRGLSKDGPQFVTRASLEALPQVETVVKPDENFTEAPKGGMRVRGVDLEVLERALGADAAAMAVEAVCGDGYAPPFPVEYVRQHHPIVVLTVEGMTPETWAEKTHTADPGPYFMAYDNFKPSFHVLSHEDRPQVPVQLVRLEFATYRRMFTGILPNGTPDADVTDGYRIAQQNCFRCHDAAGYGGTKAGRSWQLLAKDARKRPEWFVKWVRDPQSVDAKAEMPSNPRYDRATLAALTRYFSTIR